MTDPRNIAHDKKVQQEKKHRHEEVAPGGDATPQPGKKTAMEHHASDVRKVPDEAAEEGKTKSLSASTTGIRWRMGNSGNVRYPTA